MVVSWGKQIQETVLVCWTMYQTKSFFTSSPMLSLVTMSHGHSVTECGEEIGFDDH